MKKKIKIMDLFSGIGGFSKGLLDAGFEVETHYFSEIDKHAIANYKNNFKNAEYIGSVTDVSNGRFRNIEVITFGSPCQDFSLAGKRRGLEGKRSSLISEAIRIVSDIRPSVFIWENVKGSFSSNNGEDFWAILQAFTNIGGYRLEWQLLNTRWFLPQNRERIYLVGHLDERSTPRVFPIGEDESTTQSTAGTKKIPTENIRALTCKYGQRPADTFIKVMDFRYDEGVRIRKDNISPTLCATARTDGRTHPLIYQRARGYNKGNKMKICPTITSNSFPHNNLVNDIRRLTEIECERLQGFPDDWTKFGNYDGVIKEIPKTQRYKLIGNSVTVKVVEEIAKKLKTN